MRSTRSPAAAMFLRAGAIVLAALAPAACAASAPETSHASRVNDDLVMSGDAWRGPNLPAPRVSAPDPIRDDVPESVRREWIEKNLKPRGYTPARAVRTTRSQHVTRTAHSDDTIVRERHYHVDRGYPYRGYAYNWPVNVTLGWYHGFGRGRHHSRGFGYGLSLGWPLFW